MLHSGLREDGSFSEGTLFIGDPLTYNFTGSYLPENGLLGDAKYTTQCGSQVTVFFGTTKDDYIEIVDFLLENCPNATIHMQTIPYGHNIACNTVNERIKGALAHYQEQGEPRVFLIDTFTAIGNHTVDGVHLNVTGNSNWY